MQEKSEWIHFQALLLKVSKYIGKEKTNVTFMNSQWGTDFLLTQNYHLWCMNLLSADSDYIFEMGRKDLNSAEHVWDAQRTLLHCTKLGIGSWQAYTY